MAADLPTPAGPDRTSGHGHGDTRSERVRAQLAAAGVRVTRQRVAVLAVIGAGEHLDADTIAVRARDLLGTISRQAVYDTLATLTGAGLLRTIEPAGSPVLHELRVGDHHHLICRGCGRVVDVDCEHETRCLPPPDAHGFAVEQTEITWWGRCPQCRTHAPA